MTELWLDRKWLAEMEVRGITPEPEKSRVETDRIVYTFRLNPASTPARVTWYLDIMMSLWKQRSERVEKILDGVPLMLIENGNLKPHAMMMERVDGSDILAAAREKQGLERLDQIKHAIVEASGGITIIPKEG